MSLSELQRSMVALLQQRRALASNPSARLLALEHIQGNDWLSPVEQLEIYRQQYWLRHTTALVEDFAALGEVIGQTAWERLVEDYLAAHSPTGFSLRDLGAHLPAYVAEKAHWLPQQRLAADVARLEWAYIEVFDAAVAPALDSNALASLSQAQLERAHLQLSPALRLLQLDYPIVALVKRLRSPHDSPVPTPEVDPTELVVYRSGLQIHNEVLPRPAFLLLEALAADASLEEACEAACAPGPEAIQLVLENLAGWLASWVRRGWVVGIRPPLLRL
ncbi:MAG TPA: DNA-binding domain-containing protein [Polyangiaceae bacterium]|nr:DNA-binding domain-containing protein [Polyangiaceae bacterium]